MAASPRSRRTTRLTKKQPKKKRVSRVGAKKRASAESSGRARRGRSGTGGLCPRGAHAADRHSGDQQSAGDLRPRRARTALGRHHQGRRGTSGEPCDLVRRCRAQQRSRAHRAARFLRSAHAGAQRRRFADRAGGGEGSAVVGRDFRKAAGIRGRRSRSAAGGAGEPDRQCGEIHRTGQRHACRVAAARAQGQDRRRLCGLRQRHRPHAQRDQAPVPPVLAGQCLDRLKVRRHRAWAVVGQATRARHGRRHRGDATARRRHHLHAQRRDVAGQGPDYDHDRGPTASRRPGRCGPCTCSASRTIRSAASCSTPS